MTLESILLSPTTKCIFPEQHAGVLMCANHAVCYDYFDLLPGWRSSAAFFPTKATYCVLHQALAHTSNYFYNPWIASSVCTREQSCTHTHRRGIRQNANFILFRAQQRHSLRARTHDSFYNNKTII
jgi:hypothetical protein